MTTKQLQLVGVTAMLVASKYEETYPPEVGDFVYITDNAYTAAQIRKMEVKLKTQLPHAWKSQYLELCFSSDSKMVVRSVSGVRDELNTGDCL